MLKMLLVAGGLMLTAPAIAAEFPFALSARLEHVWSKLEHPLNDGEKQYNGDVEGAVIASFEIRPEVYLIGRASYPFESQLPEYAVGVEFRLYGGD